MKKLFLFFSLLSLSFVFGQNQQIFVKKLDSLDIKADNYLGQDQFDFYYYIRNNTLFKFKDAQSFEYKNTSFGEITKIDIQNPLKITLFYENFNAVVLLDNHLNEIQQLNFSENKNSILASATGIAAHNQLWIYNSLNQQLGLFNYLKNEYKTISTAFAENIKYYQTDFNSFYWIDNKNNWYTCDIFGRIKTKGKIPDFDAIEIINEHQFIYSKNNKLFLEDFEKKQKHEIELSEKTFKKFYYKDQILSIFTSKGIMNYKITTP
ncbi:hypothetical protein FQU23_013925 [Flavobacterium sp. XN-5]|uniref:hypothetical protein n=1 Tax=Flavobacterium sp. XN-5 TaxID=2599390 RepID=UPI0011CA2359|nr:hypothetical protein [Flavobacterium sp. XN-5]NGY38602.1 hypothetical protein [Flavobacterium sp. XN-5]